MSTDISDEFEEFIKKIVTENGLETSKIKYGRGSEEGNGFTASSLTVDVNDENKSLHLFCKSLLRVSWYDSLPIDKMFANEIYFYKTIYPAYQEFIKEHNVEDGFRNISKCYGVKSDLIVLDNLKFKGFDILERGKIMNDNHILFTMKNLAKFHAISFAFKDQKRELYNSFISNIQYCFTDMIFLAGYDKSLAVEMRDFLKGLDPIEDKYLLDASVDLDKTLIDVVANIDKCPCHNPVIIHGDSWCNNMMYSYDRENLESPNEIMVLDWQIMRNGSPAYDLVYFFYSVATESTIENLEYYLDVYYDVLSKSICQLGSDPQILYPFSALKEEWKKFAKFGFALGFFIIKALVADKEEIANFEKYPELRNKLENSEDIENIIPRIKNQHLFLDRMKTILKHLVKHKFL